MLDLALIVGFEWDDGRSAKSSLKHSVSQTEAEQVFLDEHLVLADNMRHSQDEPRFHALGRTIQGRLLHVTLALRHNQTKIRVISARGANRRERAIYEYKA